jgi:hypothetical protein
MLTCLVILLNKLKLYIPLESASGIPILKLLNGKTSAYNSSFLFFHSFRRPWNEVLSIHQNLSIEK